MHSTDLTNHTRARARHARVPSRRLALALAGAGLIGLSLAMGASPVKAQFKPAEQTVRTPFGPAPLSFADIVERVKPAVVSIHVTNGGKKLTFGFGGRGGRDPFGIPDDHPLKKFFKNLPRQFRDLPRPLPSKAQGSGFFISADGYVVTNNHVISGASKIMVSSGDLEKLEAELIGTDPRTDIALLKVNANRTFPFVKLTKQKVRVGDWVVAVGNPFGLGGTVTAGIVSAMGRDIGSGPYDFIQIDAAVNKGNSGGPTFNLNGEVVGVNTSIFSPSGGNVGIAFAVPANTVAAVVKQLKSSGSVSRGWLGVQIDKIDEDIAASLGLAGTSGALVVKITPNGPASRSGLRESDAIIAVNSDKIVDSRNLARKIAEYAPNTPVDVTIMRDGRKQVVAVTLGTFPKSEAELAKLRSGTTPESSTEVPNLGLTLAPAIDRSGSIREGVRIASVDPDSNAALKGLKPGDIILSAGPIKVNSPEDVAAGVKDAQSKGRRAVLLTVKSGGRQRLVGVRFSEKKG